MVRVYSVLTSLPDTSLCSEEGESSAALADEELQEMADDPQADEESESRTASIVSHDMLPKYTEVIQLWTTDCGGQQ